MKVKFFVANLKKIDYFKFRIPDSHKEDPNFDDLVQTLTLKELHKKDEDQEKKDSTQPIQGLETISSDNIQRQRVAQYFIESNEEVTNKLKNNYHILANWQNYVG